MAIDCRSCNHVAGCRRRYALSTLLSSTFLWIAHKRGSGADIGERRARSRPSRCRAWSRTTRSRPAGIAPWTASTSRSPRATSTPCSGRRAAARPRPCAASRAWSGPTQGSISLGGVVVADGQRALPPEKRDIGMVFQSYAIWPHMTVFENAAFPLRVGSVKVGRDELKRRVDEVLGCRRPCRTTRVGSATQLSGGQQQRLALARALIRRPKVLLLDEPLSNLDARLRDRMRSEIRDLQRRVGITTLYVTHDQVEALSMSDRIAVMEGGHIIQEGNARDIYRRPATRFVAAFVGSTNFLRRGGDGSRRRRRDTPAGRWRSRGGRGSRRAWPRARRSPFRASRERVAAPAGGGRDPPGDGALTGTVDQMIYMGDVLDVRVELPGCTIASRAHPSVELQRGDRVVVELRREDLSVIHERLGMVSARGCCRRLTERRHLTAFRIQNRPDRVHFTPCASNRSRSTTLGAASPGRCSCPDPVVEAAPGIVQGPGWLGLRDAKLYQPYHEALHAAGLRGPDPRLPRLRRLGGRRHLPRPHGPGRRLSGPRLDLPRRPDPRSTRDGSGVFGSGGTGGGNAVMTRPAWTTRVQGDRRPGAGRRTAATGCTGCAASTSGWSSSTRSESDRERYVGDRRGDAGAAARRDHGAHPGAQDHDRQERRGRPGARAGRAPCRGGDHGLPAHRRRRPHRAPGADAHRGRARCGHPGGPRAARCTTEPAGPQAARRPDRHHPLRRLRPVPGRSSTRSSWTGSGATS